jgi:hypothetical protein
MKNTRFLTRAAVAVTATVAVMALQLSPARAAAAQKQMTAISPAVETSAKFCPASAGGTAQRICSLGLAVSHPSSYDSFVNCLGCGVTGWARWTRVGATWKANGAQPIPSSASVLLVITKPGRVGRYRLYRLVDVHSAKARLALYRQGCVAANVPAHTIEQSFHRRLRNLPMLGCDPPKKASGQVLTAGVNELSISLTTYALVYGLVSKPMWLTVVQTTSTTCKPDPLAYTQAQRHSKIWVTWRVKGNFVRGFPAQALAPEGRFCIYLQTGGEYDHFPDGWTVQSAYDDYATGDALTGTPSTTPSVAGPTTITLTGYAPRTETLMSYDLRTPCPEYSVYAADSAFGDSTVQVSGQFTQTFTIAPFSQSGYVCSYLDNAYITVAMSTDLVTVTGTSLKDQSDYTETATQAITPLSDPVGNSGTMGPEIAAGQTVHVRCIVNGLGLAPADPVWYELDSAPWGDAYYAPAYDFYNNGQTTGAVRNGKPWDYSVPSCSSLVVLPS